jgi:hypothetical protein
MPSFFAGFLACCFACQPPIHHHYTTQAHYYEKRRAVFKLVLVLVLGVLGVGSSRVHVSRGEESNFLLDVS